MDTDNRQRLLSTELADEESTRLQIREELSKMSFAELQELKEKIGTKMYNKTMHSKKTPQFETATSFHRENKNRPREMSSKREIGRFREVVPVVKKIKRDPRFDDLSGSFDKRLFDESYAFVDDIKAKEKSEVKQQLKEESDPKRQKKIKSLLQRLDNQEKAAKDKKAQAEKSTEERREMINQVQDGKKPHFINKSTMKKMELAKKFEELKATKKLDKYLIRKRKKNIRKDRKNIA